MKLSPEQIASAFAVGVYANEACDRCGKILGHLRYTIANQPGEWCSRLCRDGVEHKAGACRGCGTAVNGRRKGALFCSAVCRVRAVRRNGQDSQNNANTPIQNKGLTDAISAFGYTHSGKEV